MKTNKAYAKRIKVTRNGKLVARKPGQDHYNGLESGRQKLGKGGTQNLQVTNAVRRRFLPGTSKKTLPLEEVQETK